MGVDRRKSGGSGPDDGSGDLGRVTLSTGQTVDLPLVTEATMLGAVFPAPREAVYDLLPAGVEPVRATPGGRAAVTLLSVEYHHVGVDGIQPYDEFGVILPAVEASTRTVPFVSALSRATSGYVWYLPVTTEPARALGVDVWGYPKVVADVAHDDEGSRRRTTVTEDGDHVLTLEVARPPSLSAGLDGYNYTVRDGGLLRVPTDVDGELGGWLLSDAVSVTFGDHDRADVLRDLDLGGRALARLFVEGRAVFHRGEPVGTD